MNEKKTMNEEDVLCTMAVREILAIGQMDISAREKCERMQTVLQGLDRVLHGE